MCTFLGGYNGAKEGYEIPAGTDIFLSVRWWVGRFELLFLPEIHSIGTNINSLHEFAIG
jgi:hypothetical protein